MSRNLNSCGGSSLILFRALGGRAAGRVNLERQGGFSILPLNVSLLGRLYGVVDIDWVTWFRADPVNSYSACNFTSQEID